MVPLFREIFTVFLQSLPFSNCKVFASKIIWPSNGEFVEGDDVLFSAFFFFPCNALEDSIGCFAVTFIPPADIFLWGLQMLPRVEYKILIFQRHEGREKKWWVGTEPSVGHPELCHCQCCACQLTWGQGTKLVNHFPSVCDQVIFTVSHTNEIHGKQMLCKNKSLYFNWLRERICNSKIQ